MPSIAQGFAQQEEIPHAVIGGRINVRRKKALQINTRRADQLDRKRKPDAEILEGLNVTSVKKKINEYARSRPSQLEVALSATKIAGIDNEADAVGRVI